MLRELRFTVVGLPATKGSTRAFVSQSTHRIIVKGDNPRTKSWQSLIAGTASLELQRPEHRGLFFEHGVEIDVCFYLPRPKALLTKKLAGQAIPHTKKPDADKLLRAVKDALSKVVWRDDAQVTDAITRKRYCAAGEFPRAVITIRESAPMGALFSEAS